MLEFSAVRRAASWLFVFVSVTSTASAQSTSSTAQARTWNDSVTLALVDRAAARRAQQLADTALRDYRATAHGYVTFLAQLGEGFPTPPKIVKADELELEVYWRAPNHSKQRIVGRRDTLLLPTDIAYHRDHLGIVQGNFASLIRLGDGDEVRDVPHPLSFPGMPLYDYVLSDSFAIGSGPQRIRVYEIKVRPKDDRQPRVVGAVYLDPEHAEVVRMNLSFTRAAFLDDALDELSVVLENRLVGGRFWLPSRQEIEIKRHGEWLDYPIRGIIRGRWEVRDYVFNLSLAPTMFTGPEIVQAPPQEMRAHRWTTGRILDSLPPDVRAVSDPDIQRVQAEARELVRARALERARSARLSARNISDFARYNRVEGLALGGGIAKPFGSGIVANARARYGLDDRQVKGSVSLSATRANGVAFRVFASRDLRDVGDVAERSTPVNGIAAQEFASDYTDLYLVRALGGSLDFLAPVGLQVRATFAYESHFAAPVRARPVTGTFRPALPIAELSTRRASLEISRPTALWFGGTELTVRSELRAMSPVRGDGLRSEYDDLRGALTIDIERPFGEHRLVTTTTLAGMASQAPDMSYELRQDFVYFGGPRSAPGYAYHSLVSNAGMSERVEWLMPAPFVPFSLGRFGRVPARGRFGVVAHVVGMPAVRSAVCTPGGPIPLPCPTERGGWFPSVGAAYLLPFDILRIDVARGLARGGRWTFNIDLSREFWPIL
jgi:hypothetical protein